MSFQTFEVEVEGGAIRSAGSEPLPQHGRGLLTIIEQSSAPIATNFAHWWKNRKRMRADEAEAFAKDVEAARATIPPLKSAWD